MNEEIEVLKEYVEALGLHEKEGLTIADWTELRGMLKDAGEFGLANYITKLGATELEDFIKTTLYS